MVNFTIARFSQTIKQDVAEIKNFFKTEQATEENRLKISLIALRTIASLGMGYGIFKSLAAVSAFVFSPIGAVVAIAVGTGVFLFARDVFLISRNISENIVDGYSLSQNTVSSGIRTIIQESGEILNGRRNFSDVFNTFNRNIIVKDTNFQSFWEFIFNKCARA